MNTSGLLSELQAYTTVEWVPTWYVLVIIIIIIISIAPTLKEERNIDTHQSSNITLLKFRTNEHIHFAIHCVVRNTTSNIFVDSDVQLVSAYYIY